MSKYKALVSFAGTISMHKGEVRELRDDDYNTKELLRVKYIEPAEKKKAKATKK